MPNLPAPPPDIDSLMDRELQQALLIRLAETHTFEAIPVVELAGEPGTQVFNMVAYNLRYLQQHGWVVLHSTDSAETEGALSVAVTALGMDIVWCDGGLLTQREDSLVRLQGSTVRRLLKIQVMGSQLLPSEKLHMMDCLQGLRSEALSLLTLQILEQAMGTMPELWRLLHAQILTEHKNTDTNSLRY